MTHTPESVMAWLYANYSAQQVAGQDDAPPHVYALVGWCNSTRNLKFKNLSKRDREVCESYVAEGAKYLELVK